MANKSHSHKDQPSKGTLLKSNNNAIITQVGLSLVSIAIISIFIFGDFQYVNVFGSQLKISSVNCWVLNDSQRQYIDMIQKNIDANKETATKLNDARQKATKEENALSLKDRKVELETNFGNLNIKLLDNAAPVTTENFIRLTSRNYFNNLNFHRIVKQDNFSVIQGGDPKGDGTGGDSAFGFKFNDEILKQQSLPNSCQKDAIITDKSEFVDADLYGKLDNGNITYKKGLVAMANSGPNTNLSQFFIMLKDTKLPASYTIFGKIDESNFAVLDKINNEVSPTPEGQSDGKPNKEIKITKTTLK